MWMNPSRKSILPANSLDPCLFFVDGSKVESQTLTAADIAFLLAVDNRIPTVLFSLEKEEGDIVKDLHQITKNRTQKVAD